MNIQVITAPLVGGLIGLVTNGLAIWMLFRPLKPVYIGKYKMPFTPGLIPKEKPRIAKAIGEIVSRDLLDKETLKGTLLSEQIKNHLYEKADEAVKRYAESDETIATIAEKIVSDVVIQEKLKHAEEFLAATVTRKAIEQNIGSSIVDYAYEGIISKMKPMLKSLTGNALRSLKEPFAAKINGMIEEKSKPIIVKFIADQAEELQVMPLKEIIEKYQDKIPQIKAYFWNVYEDIINNKLADILRTVNIAEVINNKVNELDLLELEKMIILLMKKELSALVWLGGLLGIIMGFINVLLNTLL